MRVAGRDFSSVILADFEFFQPEGERPRPLCFVAKDLVSGTTERSWVEGGGGDAPSVFSRPGTLLVAYLASAEVACLTVLGWPVTDWVLDLYAEFRNLTNGKADVRGASLAKAAAFFGGGWVDETEKAQMRALAQRGGPYSEEERSMLLRYCEADVAALEGVFWGMLPGLVDDFPLIRGRYMRAVAGVELAGIPLDAEAFGCLSQAWPRLRVRITADAEASYPGVYRDGCFSLEGFDRYLAEQGIRWPRTETGKPRVDQDTFKDWARVYPQLKHLKELRLVAGQLKLHRLAVGSDGRNRFMMGAFGSTSSRNQPSSNRNIFGLPSFLRGLVRPAPGHGLAYLDYEQQEFGIAAALSGDHAMKAAYRSGDPYLSFAVQAGAAPQGATKVTHRAVREAFKATALGVQYGMGAETLALRLGRTKVGADQLLSLHRRTYRRFWKWAGEILDGACYDRVLSTVLGWRLHLYGHTKERTVGNFPMQANGAEMLRLALCLAQDAGVRVVALVHDALLIEEPVETLDEAAAKAAAAMARASEVILGGFTLRTESWAVPSPGRLLPPGGRDMWNRVWRTTDEILGEIPAGIIGTQEGGA